MAKRSGAPALLERVAARIRRAGAALAAQQTPSPATSAEIRQLERVVAGLLQEHYGGDLLPPEPLRLHVGTTASAANFWAQGRSSSARVIEIFGEDPGGPVLDWGCGSGRTLNWLKRHAAWREHWRGCDIDKEAVAFLQSKGFHRATACEEAPPLPFAEASFVGVYAFSVLTHIPPDQHDAWYAEIHRVLRPGGRAYLTVQGASMIASGLVSDEAVLRDFSQRGAALLKQPGHCKDAALVSEGFARAGLERFFEILSYAPAGYHNMDAALVRRRH